MESLELGVDAGYFSITNKLATIDYRTCRYVNGETLLDLFLSVRRLFNDRRDSQGRCGCG